MAGNSDQYLPATTLLANHPLPRSHLPALAEYSDYRECLRWEFGFTCSLCFLHEQDLIEEGAEGTGLVWIEHHKLKAGDEAKRKAYANCLLSCRFCNNARSKIPELCPHTGAKLLDPTEVGWANHFVLVGSQLKRRDESEPDAKYTFRTYRLDDKRKGAYRENRQRRFETLERTRTELARFVPQLLELARKEMDPGKQRELVDAASAFEEAFKRAMDEVQRYRVPPTDAPAECRCSASLALPDWLKAQLQTLSSSA